MDKLAIDSAIESVIEALTKEEEQLMEKINSVFTYIPMEYDIFYNGIYCGAITSTYIDSETEIWDLYNKDSQFIFSGSLKECKKYMYGLVNEN